MMRNPVNKGTSAQQFNSRVRKTKLINIIGPMRGGIRL